MGRGRGREWGGVEGKMGEGWWRGRGRDVGGVEVVTGRGGDGGGEGNGKETGRWR